MSVLFYSEPPPMVEPEELSRLPLLLTQEEASALLELCLHSQAEDHPIGYEVMRRVGEIYKTFVGQYPDGFPCAYNGGPPQES